MRVPKDVVLGVDFQHSQNYAYYHMIFFIKFLVELIYGLPPADVEYWGILYS